MGKTLSLVKGLGMSRREMILSPWKRRYVLQWQRSGKRGRGRFGSGEETSVGTLGVVTSKQPFLGFSGLMETLIFSALRAVSSFAARVLNAPQLLLRWQCE